MAKSSYEALRTDVYRLLTKLHIETNLCEPDHCAECDRLCDWLGYAGWDHWVRHHERGYRDRTGELVR